MPELLFVTLAALMPKKLGALISSANTSVVTDLGWWYILAVTGFVVWLGTPLLLLGERDWRRLASFYEAVFGCTPVPPERDYSGDLAERVHAAVRPPRRRHRLQCVIQRGRGAATSGRGSFMGRVAHRASGSRPDLTRKIHAARLDGPRVCCRRRPAGSAAGLCAAGACRAGRSASAGNDSTAAGRIPSGLEQLGNVQAGLGISLLPRRCATSEIERGQLVAIPVPELRIPHTLRLIYRRNGARSRGPKTAAGKAQNRRVVLRILER